MNFRKMFNRVFGVVIVIIILMSAGMVAASAIDSNQTDLISSEVSIDETVSSPAVRENNLSSSQVQNKSSSGAYIVIDNDADKENIHIGDHVTWIVEAQNFGPDTAKNVKIKDTLPDGLKYVKHSTTKGTFNSETGIWDIGDLSIDDGNVKLFITTLAVSVGEKINEVLITTDTVNLNKETSESEEIDVFENPQKVHVSAKMSKISKMHETANPIFLILLSFFVLMGAVFKNN